MSSSGHQTREDLLDDQDRQLFLDRFSQQLPQNGTDCLNVYEVSRP